MVGIPPADTREVNATWLGRIVQSMQAPKMYITVTAFLGCPVASTVPIHSDIGRTPSRATANIRREAATIATLVFWMTLISGAFERWLPLKHTNMRPMTAMAVMKALPGLPNASAYSCTNGCGAFRENKVLKSGVQKRNKIVVIKPKIPVAIQLLRMPLLAIILAFFVSSAMWPDASNPVSVPAVNRLLKKVSADWALSQRGKKHTTIASSSTQQVHQFHYLMNAVSPGFSLNNE